MTAPLIDRMAEALRECAADLSVECVDRYSGTLHYASRKANFERDMAPVRTAVAILAEYDRTRSEQGGELSEDMLDAACEAFDDTYEAEYFSTGSTDNKRTALRAALTAAPKGDQATSGVGDGRS